MVDDEQQIVLRLKRHDMKALETLMSRYQVKAARAAVLITRDTALAEDVVQSVFIHLYENSHLLDATRRFEPYLMRSVVNAAVKAARKQQRFVAFPEPDGSAESAEERFAALASLADADANRHGDPQQSVERAEQQAVIAAALDQLSPQQRAAIVMRYFLDMDEAEIARRSDEPTGTIKWRLHAARKRLRGLLSTGEV